MTVVVVEKVLGYKLEITHLVVNGCSWTYCQGLENPARDGWPALLAKKLGVKVVNLAVRGCGNDSIHRRTHEYVYENLPTDSKPFFVIAWSQYWRREAWRNDFENDYVAVSFPDNSPTTNIQRALLDNWNYLDFYRKTYLYKLSVMNLFKSYNIPYFMSDYASPGQNDSDIIETVRNRFPNMVSTCLSNPNELTPFYQITQPYKPLPCGHDDLEAQVVLSDYIYDEFVKRHQKPTVVPGNFLTLDNFKISENPNNYDSQTVWR